MSGHPILYAQSCALIIADEPSTARFTNNCAQANLDLALEIAAAIAAPSLDFRKLVEATDPFVINKDTMVNIGALGRSELIIVGGLLEGAVTQIALNALSDGFDVFICVDLVISADLNREQMFLDRIRALTGIAVTSRQIMLELLLQEKDVIRRKALEALRDQYLL